MYLDKNRVKSCLELQKNCNETIVTKLLIKNKSSWWNWSDFCRFIKLLIQNPEYREWTFWHLTFSFRDCFPHTLFCNMQSHCLTSQPLLRLYCASRTLRLFRVIFLRARSYEISDGPLYPNIDGPQSGNSALNATQIADICERDR